MRSFLHAVLLCFAAALASAGLIATPAYAEASKRAPTYLASQASAGQKLYEKQCTHCHGSNLDNGEFGPPLSGEVFLQKWGNQSVASLFDIISQTMPQSAPGSLSAEQVSEALSYILKQNFVAPSDQALPTDMAALDTMTMPTPTNGLLGGLVNGVALVPPPHPTPNPLDKITPVTEAMLRNPPDSEWLTWRRTPDDSGYSPLKQINKKNVGNLALVWSWALPNGPNEATPIVHDGVMFIYGEGDVLQALNAENGDLLWQYTRRLPKDDSGYPRDYKKSIAIYGNTVLMGTSDIGLVALDVKTGKVLWDVALEPGGSKWLSLTGGPLVAKGKVIVGVGGGGPGGGFIVALDIATGNEVWRFRTIPKPGTPGGDSWNGVPYDKRTGGSVWNPGSYDPETDLVFFGPSATYDTAPLRDRIADPNVTNDALYSNTTLALDPDTGKLVWYYQHVQNDQWDLDWAFERQIFNMKVNDEVKRVVVTAGKVGIFDVLEAATGKYLTSMDLGYQTLITAIDPVTGFKTIDREHLTPGDGKVKSVCPHAEGGKNWIPDAYSLNSKLIYVPLAMSCMDLTPIAAGERGLLTTGVRLSLRPPPNSDGNFGQLAAINLETKKAVWTHRQRATSSTGALATGGGVVFAGYVDRTFSAFDDATGATLWSTRLTEVPNSNAITYAVNGRQYVAVVAGNGGNHARLFMRMMPEIKNPPNRSASVFIFAVPDRASAQQR